MPPHSIEFRALLGRWRAVCESARTAVQIGWTLDDISGH